MRLRVADVQQLPFADDTFDTVTATCVFCWVDGPVRGLREVARVLKPTGDILLLEHVRPRNPLAGWVFDRVDPLLRRTLGFHVTRETEANVVAAGLRIEKVRRWGVWPEMRARTGQP